MEDKKEKLPSTNINVVQVQVSTGTKGDLININILMCRI